jgi:signal transduction histidine kinase
VRLLAVLTTMVAAALAISQAPLEALDTPVTLRWWAIAPLVYVAEMMVVHLRYRREAHSFSLSEIPLVIGLFFAPPADLVIAVVVANLLVLTIHRRQPALKLMFNIAAFALTATVAVAVFRAIIQLGDPAGPAGWLASAAATLVGIVVTTALINRAIAAMGGTMTRVEVLSVLTMSIGGALANTTLALIAVNLLWWNPRAAWLALVPPMVVYLAYKAYVAQTAERARIKAIYEATLDLHNRPRIEDAMLSAVEHARSMVDAESAHVVIFRADNPSMAFRTSMSIDLEPISMRESKINLDVFPWADVVVSRESLRFDWEPTELMPSMDRMEDGVVVPLVNRNEETIGLLIVANRLGDLGTFDQADEELLQTLASRVAVTLENGRLQDSLNELTVLKNRLEQAAASKDQFIASVSHELRTPLTAIVGLSHELTTNGLLFETAEYGEFVRLIADQSLELSNIVDDLLVAARADSGTLQLEPSLVDLSELVESAVQTQFAQSSREYPEVSVPRRGDAFTWADPFRVRQIVRNLLQNAERYGGDDVEITIERRGLTPAVVVSDNGPGVPPGSENAIFDAYERAHGPVVQPGSVGLGLAVARQLARLMGGDLTYQRRLDRTEFVLSLPAPAPARTIPQPPATITLL